MNTRTFGPTGRSFGEIGLGTWQLGGDWGDVSEDAALATLRAAYDGGVTFFDTAEVYGPFTNEEMVGEALKPVRDRVVIATKFGFAIDPATGKLIATSQVAPPHAAGR